MFDPYKSTYGSLLNIKKIEDALIRYINVVNLNELEFEYPSTGDNRCIYITGYSDEEKELPTWEHPMVLKTMKGHTVIVNDIRRYIKKVTELPATIEEITKDKNSIDFIVIRSLLTKDFVTGDISQHRAMFMPSTTAMGLWLSGMFNTIVALPPEEAFGVEITSSVYANTLYYNKKEVSDNIDTIIARVVSAKHVFKLSASKVKERASQYMVTDHGMSELIDNVRTAVNEDKQQFILVDSLIGAMGNVWYGPGGSETPIMSLENIPTWLALLYSAVNNRSYAKSRLGTLLNKYNRVIDSKLIIKHFDNYLKDIRVE